MVYRETRRSCRSCGSSRLIDGLSLQDQAVGAVSEGIAAVLHRNPDALVFKGTVSSPIGAEVCGHCGRLELYVLEPEKLLAAVTPGAAPQAVPQGTGEDKCLGCGAHLRPELSTCPACGWSYASGDGG